MSYVPIYGGNGIPGSSVTVEQCKITDRWYTVGSAIVNEFSEWSLIGQALPVGKREARAKDNGDGTYSSHNVFAVDEVVQIPVTLEFSANKEVFYGNHRPIYRREGTAGATVPVKEDLLTVGWNKIGAALVNMNGD